MPAKLKLTYALVEQIVELKRDGLCDADIIAAIRSACTRRRSTAG